MCLTNQVVLRPFRPNAVAGLRMLSDRIARQARRHRLSKMLPKTACGECPPGGRERATVRPHANRLA